jgi:cardiolipin synthase
VSGRPRAGSAFGGDPPDSSSAVADTADWAARNAERLPPADVRQLSDAAARGVSAVHELRTTTASPVLRNICEQLASRVAGAEPGYVAGLLAGAARAVERAHRRQTVTVVWTGPESHVTSSRLTAATVVDLISEARAEILLVSYATQTEPVISTALHDAAARGVAITMLAERHADNPSYTAASTPFPGLEALRLHWPTASRPPGASLHAKIIVIDDRIALVGSANLTSRAMETNLECGILIRGGPQPRAIRDHMMDLHATRYLRRL